VTDNFESDFHDSPDELRAAEAARAAAKERPPALTGAKRQHYLPQFYLEGFTRDGFVAVFDREKNSVRRQQPANTGVIGQFYTMVDSEGRKRYEIEELLCEYEGKAKQVIAKLIDGVAELDADDRSDLAIFVSLAANRTPDAYFSPSWTPFQADRGRCFSGIVDGVSV